MAARYLYHFLPEDMEGDVLYPLNRLREIAPNSYSQQVKKYTGREELMELRIPHLNVLWNDVLHLSPMCPEIVYRYLNKRRVSHGKQLSMAYLKVPVDILRPEATVVYHYKTNGVNMRAFEGRELEEKFSRFEPALYEELTGLTAIQKKHFDEMVAAERPAFLYAGVAHILTTEPIKLSDCEQVTL